MAAIGVLLLVAAFIGPMVIAPSCGGGSAARAVEELRDQACGCESRECAHEAIDDFMAFLRDHAETEFSPATLERTERAAIELIRCTNAMISADKSAELRQAIQGLPR